MTRERLKYQMQLAMSEHHSGDSAEAQRIVDAILSAIEAAGVRLVPVEATEEMNRAVRRSRYYCEYDGIAHEDAYDIMLAASPYAPQKDETK